MILEVQVCGAKPLDGFDNSIKSYGCIFFYSAMKFNIRIQYRVTQFVKCDPTIRKDRELDSALNSQGWIQPSSIAEFGFKVEIALTTK